MSNKKLEISEDDFKENKEFVEFNGIKIKEGSLKDLKFAKENPVIHSKINKELVKNSINEFGPVRSIAIDEEDEILAGNSSTEQMLEAGIERVIIIETDGQTAVAVKRVDLSEEEKIRYAVADNTSAKAAMLNDEILKGFGNRGVSLTGVLSEKDLKRIFSPKEPKKPFERDNDYPEGELCFYVITEFDSETEQMEHYNDCIQNGFETMKYSSNRQKKES